MSLFDKRSVFQVLGNLMKKPSLLDDKQYFLDKSDFSPEDESTFYVIVFAAISNLYSEGLEEIDAIALDSFLSNYERQYKVFNDNSGVEYVQEAIDQAHFRNFDYSYKRLKKFSLLRKYQDIGIDITDIYDDSIVDPHESETMMAEFDSKTVADIISDVDKKLFQINKQFVNSSETQRIHAASGAKQLLEKYKETPDYGISLIGDLQNTIFRGGKLKTLSLRSAPSNLGKCVTGDTLIYTDKGVLPIKDVPKFYGFTELSRNKLKANVISYNTSGNKEVLETSHWYNMGKQKTIKITTTQGYSVEGTHEHPVMVTNSNGDLYFKRLQDIAVGEHIAVSVNNQLFGGNEEIHSDLAYLLGFLVGDGYLNIEDGINPRNHLSYSKKDEEIHTRVNELIKLHLPGVSNIRRREHGRSLDFDFGNHETINFLKDNCGMSLTTSPKKAIPSQIMTSTKGIVKRFLQGLFDTDASVTCNSFEYSTASKKLASQVHVLLLNFGIVSKLREKQVNDKPYYIISIHNYPMLLQLRNEIGFDLATDKKVKLNECISEEKLASNSDYIISKDLLMQLHEHLKMTVPEYHYDKQKSLSYRVNDLTFYENAVVGRRVSREKIKRIANHTSLKDVGDDNLNLLCNLANNIFADTVKSISYGEEEVYDFTVPKNHSFVANGIINHNTRLALAEATDMAIDRYYDWKKEKWIDNGNRENVCFISTENEAEELQSTLLAYISGVAETKIKDGETSEEEDAILEEAVEVLEATNFQISYMPDFDMQQIETEIKDQILENNIQYIYFDYIHISLQMLTELAEASKGMKMREDMVLFMFMNKLDQIRKKYNVFIKTATQVNGEWKNSQNADSSILRGSKALADKATSGVIALSPTNKDLEAIKPILETGFYPDEPNVVYHIYKNRHSKHKDVKLWLYVDYDTMRQHELFLTTNNYEIVNIEPTKINAIAQEV